MPASDSAQRARTVGSCLRESRECRGISLEEAARVTRIGKNYLTALEEGMFHTLPNIAYVKGFLRAYAAFLGLSGDEIIARYERPIPSSPRHPAEVTAAPPVRCPEEKTPSRRGRWFVPFVLLALVVAATFIIDDRGTRPEKAPPPPVAPAAVRVAAPLLPARSSAQRRTAEAELPAETGKRDIGAANVEPKGNGIVLKLKVNQDSWLSITIDDAVSQQYDLKAGDLIEWKGDRAFTLDLGDPAGIEAEFNGRPLKPFGEPGKPAHVVLKADGMSP